MNTTASIDQTLRSAAYERLNELHAALAALHRAGETELAAKVSKKIFALSQQLKA